MRLLGMGKGSGEVMLYDRGRKCDDRRLLVWYLYT